MLIFCCSQPRRVVKTPYHTRGNSRLLVDFSPVSYLSTLTEAHSLLRIWDHQSVSYVPDTGSFWLLLEFILIKISENSTANWVVLESWPWCRIEPRHTFHPGLASGELIFWMRTQVFSINNFIFIVVNDMMQSNSIFNFSISGSLILFIST